MAWASSVPVRLVRVTAVRAWSFTGKTTLRVDAEVGGRQVKTTLKLRCRAS